MGNSFRFILAANRLIGLKQTQKAVLNVVALHADNDSGECYLGIDSILQEACLSRNSNNSVRRALRELDELQIVSTIGQHPTKYGYVNIFKINAAILERGYLVPGCSSTPVLSAAKGGAQNLGGGCSKPKKGVFSAPLTENLNSSVRTPLETGLFSTVSSPSPVSRGNSPTSERNSFEEEGEEPEFSNELKVMAQEFHSLQGQEVSPGVFRPLEQVPVDHLLSVMKWAFKTSEYWEVTRQPRTADNFVRRYGTLSRQYTKYIDSIKAGRARDKARRNPKPGTWKDDWKYADSAEEEVTSAVGDSWEEIEDDD